MSIDYNHILDLLSQGHWEEAHQIVQNNTDQLSCLIHAYLHRQQNDLENAQYWYHRIGEKMPDISLEEEFERLNQLARLEH